jgi:hypothetical protein
MASPRGSINSSMPPQQQQPQQQAPPVVIDRLLVDILLREYPQYKDALVRWIHEVKVRVMQMGRVFGKLCWRGCVASLTARAQAHPAPPPNKHTTANGQ